MRYCASCQAKPNHSLPKPQRRQPPLPYARIPHKKRATPPAINRGPVIVCAGSLSRFPLARSLCPQKTIFRRARTSPSPPLCGSLGAGVRGVRVARVTVGVTRFTAPTSQARECARQ
jgi:hypothetical protein